MLVAAWGLLQHAGMVGAPWGIARIDGTFGNPAYLAGYLLIHTFVAVFLLARSRGGWRRAAIGAALAIDLWVLSLTATRGALVGLVAGAAAGALVALWRGEGRARRAAASVLALALVAGAGAAALSHSPLAAKSTMLARLGAIGPSDADSDVRLRVWAIAWDAFRERPLLGWGQENFTTAVDRHFDPVLAHDSEWVDRAHDLVLDWLVAGGSVGGLAYISRSLRRRSRLLWRRARAGPGEAAALVGLVVGDFVALLFLFDSLMTYLLFATVLAYLHWGAVRERAPAAAAAPPALRRAAGPVLALGLAVALGLDGRGLLAAAALGNALEADSATQLVAAPADAKIVVTPPRQTDDAPAATRDGLARAIGYGSFATGDAREALALLAYDLLTTGSDPWARANLAPYAVAEMTKQVRDDPQARGLLFLGSLLVALDRNAEGIAALDRARTLAPRRQTILEMLAIAYRQKGDGDKALNLALEAFALDPTYDEARLAYAAAAITAGDGARARQILVERYGTDLVPDDRIIAAYDAAKDSDRVIALWRLRIASDPGNPRYRIALSGALMRAGRGIDAVKELGGLNRLLTPPQR